MKQLAVSMHLNRSYSKIFYHQLSSSLTSLEFLNLVKIFVSFCFPVLSYFLRFDIRC